MKHQTVENFWVVKWNECAMNSPYGGVGYSFHLNHVKVSSGFGVANMDTLQHVATDDFYYIVDVFVNILNHLKPHTSIEGSKYYDDPNNDLRDDVVRHLYSCIENETSDFVLFYGCYILSITIFPLEAKNHVNLYNRHKS